METLFHSEGVVWIPSLFTAMRSVLTSLSVCLPSWAAWNLVPLRRPLTCMFCGCPGGDAGQHPPLVLSVQRNKHRKCSSTVQVCDSLGIFMVLNALEAHIWMSLGRGWVIKAQASWRSRSRVRNPEIIPRDQGK